MPGWPTGPTDAHLILSVVAQRWDGADVVEQQHYGQGCAGAASASGLLSWGRGPRPNTASHGSHLARSLR